ncbi:uncharacterized protein LOC119675931 [Teleopsis dalmanni]|uniref:uncharacterized protein LOC119675931 n=1 Tax=Teleopsis dalmanni TaxID=139649 RepID=UPI0018CF1DC6|nr:uncharacterized protein LOC119675931 [Teleopsis dalmanni]
MQRGRKLITILIKDRPVQVSIDRVKAAYLLSEETEPNMQFSRSTSFQSSPGAQPAQRPQQELNSSHSTFSGRGAVFTLIGTLLTNDLDFSLDFSISLDLNVPVSSRDILIGNSEKLLQKFGYPYELMPLMYVIVRYAKADMEEASRSIDEGQYVVNEYSRQHNLNMYDGGELRTTTRQCG